MKRFRLILVAMTVLSLILTACGTKKEATNPNNPTSPSEPTAVFHYVTTDKPATFDPAMVSDTYTHTLIGNVYSGLVGFNDKGEVIPDLAAKMPDVSADGKTYTFTLRDNLKFSDGTPLTADDVVRSLVRAMNPALGSSTNSSYLDDILGYHTFLAAQAQIDADAKAKKITEADQKSKTQAAYDELKKNPGVVAKDAKTVVITIAAPVGYFLGKLGYPTSYVVGKNAPTDKPIDPSPENVKAVLGSGPFTLESYVEGSKYIMKRNPNFYGAKAKVASVEVQIIKDPQASLAAYRSGQLDFTSVASADYATVKGDAVLGKELHELPAASVSYFTLNEQVWEPAKKLEVRQAFNYAIDRDKYIQVVTNGTQFPAYSILPDSIPGALGVKAQVMKFDANKAKDLMKQAGYDPTKLTLKLTYRSGSAASEKAAQFLQAQLQDNLGIKVNLDPMEWTAMLKAQTANTQLEAYTMGWSADYMDPQNFLSVLLHTGSDYNHYGYSNKEFDATLDKADKMTPGPARNAEYGKAEQMAINDAAWVPLSFGKTIYLTKPTVKGYLRSAQGALPLNTVEITK